MNWDKAKEILKKVRDELDIYWDVVKTGLEMLPKKVRYTAYGLIIFVVLLTLMGAAQAENAPDSNFGFIGGHGDVVFACYVSDATVDRPPTGIVLTCLILQATNGVMISDGSVAHCTREPAGTYACGTYEDMHTIASGI